MEQGEHRAHVLWVTSHQPELDEGAHVVWPAIVNLQGRDLHVHLPEELLAKVDREGGTFAINVHRDAS